MGIVTKHNLTNRMAPKDHIKLRNGNDIITSKEYLELTHEPDLTIFPSRRNYIAETAKLLKTSEITALLNPTPLSEIEIELLHWHD